MTVRTEVFRVEQSRPDLRLDLYLRARFPAASRSALQRLIESGDIRVEGRVVKPTHHPRAGEQIEVRWPEARPASLHPEPITLAVLFEDDRLLVINKPPSLVVHPGAGHKEHTLVHALLHHCAGGLSGVGGVARPGIVHRLDKETSGCLVVAKTDAAHLALSAQFAARKVEKVYAAIVCGELTRERGDIHAAISRHPSHRKHMAVNPEAGRPAWTSYEVLERLREATLVQARLHTGRTHQLRVHFQFIGHPLVGDQTYGRRQNQRLHAATAYTAPRQMLHAWKLAFIHPHTGQRMEFESPWPEDFREALRVLKIW